jgi:hypothetical protein
MSAKLELEIALDSKGAVTGVKSLDTAIGGLNTSTQGADKSGKNFLDTMFAQVTAANLAAKGIGKLTDFLGDSIAAYADAEKINTKLNSALRAHDESVIITGKHIEEFASKMQFLTGVDDEQVKSLETLARSYGMQKELIDDAVKGTLGLVELYGGDYETVLKAVSKAYEGQWGAIEKLIPELKNISDESDKLKLLQEKMGDGIQSATDRMKSQAGQVQQLKSEWENFKESFGGVVASFLSGFANMNNALDMRRLAQQGLMDQMAESDKQERLVSQERQNRINNEMILERGQAEAEAKWAKENDEYIKNGFRTEKQVAEDKKKLNVELKESYQDRFDREQEGYEMEEGYIAFVNAKLLPIEKELLKILDSVPKSQDLANVLAKAGIPIVNQLKTEEEYLAKALGITVEELRKKTEKLKEDSDAMEDAAEKNRELSQAMSDGQFLLGAFRGALEKAGIELGDTGDALLDCADSAMGFIGALATGDPIAIIAAGFQLLGDVINAVGEIFSREMSEIEQAMAKVNIEMAIMAVNAALLAGPAVANLDAVTAAAQRMADQFDRTGAAIRQAKEALDRMGIGTGSESAPPPTGGNRGKWTPDVYAASGFYSPRLSSDTLIQAHAGESVNITPAAQNGGGGKTTNLNVIINGPGITPESAADAIITAHRNNTRGLRSLLEN